MESKEKYRKDILKLNYCAPFGCNIWWNNALEHVMQHMLTSWCINRFHCEWGLFCNTNGSWHEKKCGCPFLVRCIVCIASNYKTIFFVEWGNCTHQYMLKPIWLSTIWTIGFVWLSSHSLQCETKCWGTTDEPTRLCIFCPKHVWESKFHTLLCLLSNVLRETYYDSGLISHIWPSKPIKKSTGHSIAGQSLFLQTTFHEIDIHVYTCYFIYSILVYMQCLYLPIVFKFTFHVFCVGGCNTMNGLVMLYTCKDFKT